MTLFYSTLAILDYKCCSGYELWKIFSESTNYCWKATQQQIYRELAKLEAIEAIYFKVIFQEGRPDKKVYSITAKGRNLLQSWIETFIDPRAVKEELLVKILVAHLVPPKIILRELQRHHQIHSESLFACKQKEHEFFSSNSELSLKQKCEYLTLRWGISHELAWIAWCEEAISVFKAEIDKCNCSSPE